MRPFLHQDHHGSTPDCGCGHGCGCGHNHAPAPATYPQDTSPTARCCAHGSLGEHHPKTDAICLDQVNYRYPGQSRLSANSLALRNVTLHVEQGCNLGIIGPNGAGKTTLIKIILGLLDGYSGQVHVLGMNPKDACRRGDVIGYVPQRHDVEWRFPLSAQQVVMMGLTGKTGLFKQHRPEDRDYALHIMERVGISDLRKKNISQLSGGQQQRLFIARALAARPRILILDEPLVGVDETGQRQFAQLIHDLHRSLQLTVVIVSHDLQAIAAGCHRVACLKQSIHYHDAPAGLTRQVLAQVFEHEVGPILDTPVP